MPLQRCHLVAGVGENLREGGAGAVIFADEDVRLPRGVENQRLCSIDDVQAERGAGGRSGSDFAGIVAAPLMLS